MCILCSCQQMMLEDIKKVREKIPNIFMPLMVPHMQRVSFICKIMLHRTISTYNYCIKGESF